MRFGRFILVSLLSVIFTPAYAQVVGVFSQIQGDVQFIRDDYYFTAATGVEIHAQDIIETGNAASAQLDMADGSLLRLGPDTRLALSEYHLDANQNVIAAGLEVLSGWLRFAVSKLRDEGRYTIETPTMTIGIRGTEGVIETESEQASLHLEEGAVDIYAADQEPSARPAAQIKTGEFISRVHGRPFQRADNVPGAFQRRLPPAFQKRMQARAQALEKRGIPPRLLRPVSPQDAQRYLEKHPHMRNKLEQRFRERIKGDPVLLEKLQKQRQERVLDNQKSPHRSSPNKRALDPQDGKLGTHKWGEDRQAPKSSPLLDRPAEKKWQQQRQEKFQQGEQPHKRPSMQDRFDKGDETQEKQEPLEPPDMQKSEPLTRPGQLDKQVPSWPVRQQAPLSAPLQR